MKTLTQTSGISSFMRNGLVAAGLLVASASLQAEPLQANTIYVTDSTGLYAIDETRGTATRVGDASTGFSSIQDIAFDGNELYGLTRLMQFFKYDTETNEMIALNGYSSYAQTHRGFAAYNGVFYAAENRVLQTANPDAGTFGPVGPYGLGAGEEVDDLAFSSDGTLYAAVNFNITYGTSYLATLDTNTGEMNLIGNTFISALRGLTEKDGVLYGINSVGDLYEIDKVSGMGTLLASDVVSGAYGMATSPSNTGGGSIDSGEGSSSGGALSWPLMILMVSMVMVRTFYRHSIPTVA